MRGRSLMAMAVGMVLGVVGMAVVVRQPPAQAQDRRAGWEYRVVYAPVGNPEDSARAMTDQFGRLAADGWEYIGPATEASLPGPGGQHGGVRGAFLVFKRPRP